MSRYVNIPPSSIGTTTTTTLSANAQTVSWTGLDGNTDWVYRFDGYILFPERAASEVFVIRINGATTNMTGNGRVVSISNGAESAMSASAVDGGVINDIGGTVGGNGGTLKFWAEIYSQTGQWRLIRTWSYVDYNAVYSDFSGIATSVFKDTSTNISTLDITSTSADSILSGSVFSLTIGGI